MKQQIEDLIEKCNIESSGQKLSKMNGKNDVQSLLKLLEQLAKEVALSENISEGSHKEIVKINERIQKKIKNKNTFIKEPLMSTIRNLDATLMKHSKSKEVIKESKHLCYIVSSRH